jgi:hypothetical protein
MLGLLRIDEYPTDTLIRLPQTLAEFIHER